MAALSKGWSLFSSVVASATRTVNENVIQPGMERVLDPEFQASVKGYAAEAGKRAGQVGATANEWGKQSLGVDVAGQLGGVVGGVGGMGNRSREGYGALSQDHEDESSTLYNDRDDDDFFGNYSSGSAHGQSTTNAAPTAAAVAAPVGKKADDWDEWKDF